MASAWGKSWGYSWGASWGSIAPPALIGIGGVVDTRKRDKQDREAQAARDDWERARREAVERAFEDVFGENVQPEAITEPKKREVIEAARFELRTDGIEAKLSALSAILREMIMKAERDRDDDEAVIMLLLAD